MVLASLFPLLFDIRRGFWAEVPAIKGCHTQGDTWDELLPNIYEAIEACLAVDAEEI